MNYKLLLFVFVATSSMAHSEKSNLGDFKGWSYEETAKDPALKEFAGGAKGILSPEDQQLENPVTVLVYEIEQKSKLALGPNVKPWREILYKGQFNPKKTAIKDRTYEKDGQLHYFAEISSDVSEPNMMPSVVLGKVIGNKTYLFIFENRRDVYQKNIKDVLQLYHQL